MLLNSDETSVVSRASIIALESSEENLDVIVTTRLIISARDNNNAYNNLRISSYQDYELNLIKNSYIDDVYKLRHGCWIYGKRKSKRNSRKKKVKM